MFRVDARDRRALDDRPEKVLHLLLFVVVREDVDYRDHVDTALVIRDNSFSEFLGHQKPFHHFTLWMGTLMPLG